MSHSSRRELVDSVINLSQRRLQKCLPALTIEETMEFEILDAIPPFDDNGELAWKFEGQPTNDRERRWLTLYRKLTSAPSPRTSVLDFDVDLR